ncbi:MAG: replication protein DnaD [Haloplasmataceae bacterium]|nr:replication protein DnaD [Haloplasmataceae bacterium]
MSEQFIKRLINNRIINVKDYIINNYVKLGLNEQTAMLLLHIYNFSEQGFEFLSINALKEKMSIDFIKCADLVFKLVQENLIAFEIKVDNGKTKEKYTLEPLYNKILDNLMNENNQIDQVNNDNVASDLVGLIENDFGRTLSSFEIQYISAWLNEYKYDFSLIKLAIKEAIFNKVYNLKYVDRILLNWQQSNINTVEKAMEYTKTFKRYENKTTTKNNNEQEEYVSWMR